MKKRILIFCSVLLAFSLTAYGFANWEGEGKNEVSCTQTTATFEDNFTSIFDEMEVPDLVYKVDSRFLWTITKEDLRKAKSLKDIFPKEATKNIETFFSSKVAVLKADGEEIVELGNEGVFNEEQLNLLQTIDYSTNFYVYGDFGLSNYVINRHYQNHVIYYVTVVPEKEATPEEGQELLIDYLKESTKTAVTIIRKAELEPGQVNFTVAKDGTVKDVILKSTCGYASIDTTLVDLVQKMPQKWIPATNEKGEKVEQEFVFFFGLEGC